MERAVAVMEQLTEPLRRRTGRTDLWLAMASCGLVGPRPRISVPCGGTIILRLNESFAPFIDLPQHEGKPWHLTRIKDENPLPGSLPNATAPACTHCKSILVMLAWP